MGKKGKSARFVESIFEDFDFLEGFLVAACYSKVARSLSIHIYIELREVYVNASFTTFQILTTKNGTE